MKRENKTRGMKKICMKMLLAMLIGGVLGGIGGVLFFHFGGDVEEFFKAGMGVLQSMILPGMVLITGVSVLAEEICLGKLKAVCMQMDQAEEEEADLISYREEKYGAILQCINVASQVLCITVLASGYQTGYIESSNKNAMTFLAACVLFCICFFYDGITQARYVKLLQNVHPEKRGDISSKNFQKQWLESCDEAEKEVIYQSSYKTYIFMSKCIAVLLLVTMISHLFLKTGIMAILVVGVMYLVMVVKFSCSCVALQKVRGLR